MDIQKHQFDASQVEILNLGDVHYGDANCDRKLLERTVEYIFDNPNTYWVSTGDVLNVALKGGVSNVYTSQSPEEEYEECISLLEPIADKCLGLVGSNHHHRIEKEIGMSLDKLFCKELGIPFLGETAIVNVTVGRCAYYIGLAHAVGGGRTQGAKTNASFRLSEVYQGLDLYMTGHTHSYRHFVTNQTVVDRKRNKLTTVESHFLTTGHFLDWDGSYAERMLLPSMPKGAAMATLSGNTVGVERNKRISVNLFN